MSTGWLLRQLPRVMADDEVIAAFVLGFEEVADTVRDRIDAVEHCLDPGLAPPAMLAYLAAWLGLQLDPVAPDAAAAREAQRELMRVAGKTLPVRGTAEALIRLLVALTGDRSVTVEEVGGVYFSAADVPAHNPEVTVRVRDPGGLSPAQLRAFLHDELPVNAVLRLYVNGREVEA